MRWFLGRVSRVPPWWLAPVSVVLLASAVVPLLVACERTSEVEGPDATPTAAPQSTTSATAEPAVVATSTAVPTTPTVVATASPGAASATPLPNPTLPPLAAEQERLRQEEDAKPKFEGVVNGIRLYPATGKASPREDACSDAEPGEVEQITMDAVAGTPMEITPTYLPDGAEEVAPMSPPVACKGTVVYVERRWNVRGRGADFSIVRRQGEQAIDTDASADRTSAATVGGKRAVLVAPLTPAGYGYSMVIVAEGFGLTTVISFGLPLDESVKIAEGLK